MKSMVSVENGFADRFSSGLCRHAPAGPSKMRSGTATALPELHLPVVTTPEPATAQLLAHLGLRLPKGPKEIANVVPKTRG